MTMLFIGSHATRTSSGNSRRGLFISPRYQLMTGIIYPGKRQFKRAIPACQGQKPRARHGQRKLAATHREVVSNLESIQGALLRMNRSIQSEGTFGIMKNNRWYKRIVRKGMEQVRLEIFLVSIGHNLYKYHNKGLRLKKAA